MWIKDIQAACDALPAKLQRTYWKTIYSAYDGVVFKAEDGQMWKYFTDKKELVQLSDWKRGKMK